MDNVRFYKTFSFRLISHREFQHNDNSGGIDCHFLARMRSGSGRIVPTSGEALDVSAGDIFYLPRGLHYHSYWTPEDGMPAEWESFRFTQFPLEREAAFRPSVLPSTPIAEELLNRLSQNLTVTPLSVGLLYQALGELFPYFEEVHVGQKELLLRRATEYISQHPDLRVSELARFCNMSESGLYAFFKQYAGASPIEVKNRILTDRAVALLESTDLSVEEICERLGFSSLAYFRKLIRTYTGRTPGNIRRESKQI